MTIVRSLRLAVLVGFASVGAAAWAADKKDANKELAAERAAVRKFFPKAKITLADAIKAALAKFPGGKVVEAFFDAEAHELIYQVEVITGGKHKMVMLDAATGKVIGAINEEGEDKSDIAMEESIAKSAISFSTAIELAAKKVPGGKPFDVHPDKENSKLVIDVEVVDGKKFLEVMIDPTSGKVVSVSEATN